MVLNTHARELDEHGRDGIERGVGNAWTAASRIWPRSGELNDVAWPKMLDPVDDLLPATIILSMQRQSDRLQVRGVSHDNDTIRSVTVYGQ